MQDGFLRAAAASIPVAVADPRRNAAAVCARIDQAHRARAALLVLPELCVTGYTCGDLFFQQPLQRARGQRLSLVPLQMGTVAPGASVRAARQVQRERHLVGNFLKDDIVSGVFQHDVGVVSVTAAGAVSVSAAAWL